MGLQWIYAWPNGWDWRIWNSRFTFTRYSTTVEGLVLEFTAEISGPDLLIAYLIYDVNQIERQDYRKQYLHFSLAMALRDFASY